MFVLFQLQWVYTHICMHSMQADSPFCMPAGCSYHKKQLKVTLFVFGYIHILKPNNDIVYIIKVDKTVLTVCPKVTTKLCVSLLPFRSSSLFRLSWGVSSWIFQAPLATYWTRISKLHSISRYAVWINRATGRGTLQFRALIEIAQHTTLVTRRFRMQSTHNYYF